MKNEHMDLYNYEWEQFIHAGAEGSFTDWLIQRMLHIATTLEERLEGVQARVSQMQRTMIPKERVEMLQRENQSLRSQMEFERGRNATSPDVRQPRPEPGYTPPPPTVFRPDYGPRGGLDEIRQQERRESLRRRLERMQVDTQNRDRG